MKYFSSAQIAKKWNVSQRWVINLCKQGRVDGAQRAGSTWIIREDAEKPVDARIKSGKYVKAKEDEVYGSAN